MEGYLLAHLSSGRTRQRPDNDYDDYNDYNDHDDYYDNDDYDDNDQFLLIVSIIMIKIK